MFVIWYAVVQARSGDYKEMMTAIITVMLKICHIARTVWGLVQLREYISWCRHTLASIFSASPKDPFELSTHPFQLNGEDLDFQDSYSFFHLDSDLTMNSDIVDNEFTARYVSVSVS